MVHPADEHDVFISYAHEDAEHAIALREALDRQGVDTYRDVDSSRDAGTIPREVAAAIEACARIVIVWSKDALDSDWVISEGMYALQHGKPLVQVRVGRVTIPPPFNGRAWVELQGTDFDELAEAIAGKIDLDRLAERSRGAARSGARAARGAARLGVWVAWPIVSLVAYYQVARVASLSELPPINQLPVIAFIFALTAIPTVFAHRLIGA